MDLLRKVRGSCLGTQQDRARRREGAVAGEVVRGGPQLEGGVRGGAALDAMGAIAPSRGAAGLRGSF